MRYLTQSIPGTGGVFKETPEDFLVEEIPLYTPCGEGEHTYIEIEKRGVTTLDAVRAVARACRLPEREVGYAGMKDARGVTRQFFSLPRVPPDKALSLQLRDITILSAALHRNKLRLGHLAGNRFRIRIRNTSPGAELRASETLAVLSERGVPNLFGEQRYGAQGNSHLVGRAMLRGDWGAAVEEVVGSAASVRDERWRRGIELFSAGCLQESLEAFPPHCAIERDLIRRLLRNPDNYRGAMLSLNRRLLRLYLSALQSSLFDQIVGTRLDSLGTVREGDIAFIHEKRACFLVTDAAAEATRAERGEISPTGPVFGTKMLLPAGAQREIEDSVLASHDLSISSFDLEGDLRMEGERRPLRVFPDAASVEAAEEGIVVAFDLPRGSYATAVLREIMKNGNIPVPPPFLTSH